MSSAVSGLPMAQLAHATKIFMTFLLDEAGATTRLRSAGHPCSRLLDRPSSTLYFESVAMILSFLVSLGLRGNGDDDFALSAFVRDRSTVRGGSLLQGNDGFDECSKVPSVKLLCDFN